MVLKQTNPDSSLPVGSPKKPASAKKTTQLTKIDKNSTSKATKSSSGQILANIAHPKNTTIINGGDGVVAKAARDTSPHKSLNSSKTSRANPAAESKLTTRSAGSRNAKGALVKRPLSGMK